MKILLRKNITRGLMCYALGIVITVSFYYLSLLYVKHLALYYMILYHIHEYLFQKVLKLINKMLTFQSIHCANTFWSYFCL